MMGVKRRTCSKLWWYNRLGQNPPSPALILGTCRGRRPMGRTAMVPAGSERNGRAFGCKRPSAATRSRAWARFAMRWSAAITSLLSLGGCSAGSIARRGATWDGSNWPHVSSCSVRVLSHSPKPRRAGPKQVSGKSQAERRCPRHGFLLLVRRDEGCSMLHPTSIHYAIRYSRMALSATIFCVTSAGTLAKSFLITSCECGQVESVCGKSEAHM
jgi:hypothetical protein